MAKKNTTLSIDENIKKNFSMECIRNDVEMSETVETMMLNYIEASNEMHKAIKNGE